MDPLSPSRLVPGAEPISEMLETVGYFELDDEEDDEEEDGEVYETTCPNCEENIFFDETILADGEVQCPNCGEKLEFDLDDQGCCGRCGSCADDADEDEED